MKVTLTTEEMNKHVELLITRCRMENITKASFVFNPSVDYRVINVRKHVEQLQHAMSAGERTFFQSLLDLGCKAFLTSDNKDELDFVSPIIVGTEEHLVNAVALISIECVYGEELNLGFPGHVFLLWGDSFDEDINGMTMHFIYPVSYTAPLYLAAELGKLNPDLTFRTANKMTDLLQGLHVTQFVYCV